MTGRRRSVPQSIRPFYLAIYLAFLFLMNRLAFGQGLPLTTARGCNSYSGDDSTSLHPHRGAWSLL